MQHNRLQHRASSVNDRSGVDSFERILESLAARPKYLPEWPDTQRAMPNEILRSALFNCRNRNQARLFMKDAEIAV
ncbi:MAG: plasmid replication initiator TrfA, partial [Desulfuromonadaceae bacterium]|nr:plasmid replication initiator TrfA [Desulfuromonadaceae bacterium]